jgi:ATP-binding cassette subfamily B protein
VRANISLGLNVSEDRLNEVKDLVQASFVDRLPQRLDTRLTEGATNISTGERQLLSFARILAHDPRIIIMDEATANIDTETEQLIQKAVETIMSGRTSLVIAHRLSTIKNADRILVMSRGELVEEGTHDSLISQRGIYYNLYKLQYQQAS